MITIDGRCHCSKCRATTEDIYRMIGACGNCGTANILMLFRAGDPARNLDCPVCGNWSKVMPQRLATPDEVPASEPADQGGEAGK